MHDDFLSLFNFHHGRLCTQIHARLFLSPLPPLQSIQFISAQVENNGSVYVHNPLLSRDLLGFLCDCAMRLDNRLERLFFPPSPS